MLKCIENIDTMKLKALIGYDFVLKNFSYKKLVSEIDDLYKNELQKRIKIY